MLSRTDSYRFIKGLLALSENSRSKLAWVREGMATKTVKFLVLILITVMAFGTGTSAHSTAGARSGAAMVPSSEVSVGITGLSERAIKTLRAGEGSALLNFSAGPADNAVTRAFVANSASLRVDLEKGMVKLSGHGASLRLDLIGANSNVTLVGAQQQKLRADDNGKEHQASYRQVEYRDIYAGIDARVSAGNGLLSYSLNFAPGASPTWVAAEFTGAGKPVRSTSGELKFGRINSGWTVMAPVAYQEMDGKKFEIPANFTVDENGHVGLSIASYDRSKPLTVTLKIKG